MATPTLLYDCFASLNGVDISTYIKAIAIPMTVEELDATVMAAARTKIFEPGLKGFSISIEFLNDFTDNELDEDTFALLDACTKFAFVFRVNKTTSIGAANPEYRCASVFIKGFTSVGGGQVGTLAGGTLALSNCAALTRHTS